MDNVRWGVEGWILPALRGEWITLAQESIFSGRSAGGYNKHFLLPAGTRVRRESRGSVELCSTWDVDLPDDVEFGEIVSYPRHCGDSFGGAHRRHLRGG